MRMPNGRIPPISWVWFHEDPYGHKQTLGYRNRKKRPRHQQYLEGGREKRTDVDSRRPGTTIRQRRDYNNRNGKVSVTGRAGHYLAERRDI
jgi:hypothetical protein